MAKYTYSLISVCVVKNVVSMRVFLLKDIELDITGMFYQYNCESILFFLVQRKTTATFKHTEIYL